jgi:hypothetical protein
MREHPVYGVRQQQRDEGRERQPEAGGSGRNEKKKQQKRKDAERLADAADRKAGG